MQISMIHILILIIAILSFIVILFLISLKRKDTKEIAKELIIQFESQKIQDLEAIINRIKDSFGALSSEALSRNTQEVIKLANEILSKQIYASGKELEEKKRLIDQTLDGMKTDLQKIEELVINFEKDREKKFGELVNQLKFTAEQTKNLQETTNQLRTALANTKTRGQWGERMAEDVLRLAGFVEGINYLKQRVQEIGKSRPDYTFILPQNLKVNMDVKFPLDNYLIYLEAQGEVEKDKYKNLFLKDVKNRIKEVTTKEYISPQENTLDYVIVFIPNEQVYAFINENDSSILDEALKNKVILCSPTTLYAILAVMRQAIDNFNLEKTAAKILSLLSAFNKQWFAFVKSLERMGKKIDEAKEEFNNLTTTRRSQLERPLREIEELRNQKGLETSFSKEETFLENEEEKG